MVAGGDHGLAARGSAIDLEALVRLAAIFSFPSLSIPCVVL